jgi:hypothetical protein
MSNVEIDGRNLREGFYIVMVISSDREFNWSWRAAVEERGHVLDKNKDVCDIENDLSDLSLYFGILMLFLSWILRKVMAILCLSVEYSI